MDKKKVVEIKGLVKNYGTRGFQTRVLKGIDLLRLWDRVEVERQRC